jgi:hypothetical protein
LEAWGQDLATYDPRPMADQGQPFAWDPERRAQLRAELDAYYGRLYDLTRDELRYILDPKEVMGHDYPSETFRVLKEAEIRTYGEYRTRRLVLEAWDALEAASAQSSAAAGAASVQYSPLGMIRTADEARLAGLLAALFDVRPGGFTVSEVQALLARTGTAGQHLVPADSHRLSALVQSTQLSTATQLLDRVLPIIQRLESMGSVVRQNAPGEAKYVRSSVPLPADVAQHPNHVDVARLLVAAEQERMATASAADAGPGAQRQTGTR